jgi:cytochrome c-type biogenesis protein
MRHLARHTRALQQGFGIVVVLIAIAMFYQYDTVVTVWLSNFYPDFTAAGL